MNEKDKNRTYQKLIEIENAIPNISDLEKVVELAYYAVSIYRYHNIKHKNRLFDLISYFNDHEILWPEYYLLDRELCSDRKLNLEVQDLLNSHIKILKEMSNTILQFAYSVLEGKRDTYKLYNKYLLASCTVKAYNLKEVFNGLVNPVSHETYKKDIAVMNIVAEYLNTGRINTFYMSKVQDYRDLWPSDKIGIYSELNSILDSQEEKVLVKQ